MSFRSIARVGLIAALGTVASFVASPAQAATSCSPDSLTCAIGTASLSAGLRDRLATEVDSGWMEKGPLKIRTHFTIDPVRGQPLFTANMPKGAIVEASWPEKGSVTLRPLTGEGAQGTMNVRYTLAPRLDAQIYGVTVSYDSTQLLAKIQGSSFNYDARASSPLLGWGFAGGKATAAAPPLDQSTIFSLPFSTLGIDPGTAEGTLAIQAIAKPTFAYKTTEILFDSASVQSADGSTKIPVADADFLEVNATVMGELAVSGSLDVRPVVVVDSAYGVPTFGLTKFSFSVVSKPIGGSPTPVSFEPTSIHIPLPNVKVPGLPFNIGEAKAGTQVDKSVTIDSTGEMDGLLKFESSDPQFVVPTGEVHARSKSKYDLKVIFKPTSDGPASATITVHSNDPDSPEQTFRVAANGASLDPETSPSGEETAESKPSAASDGCVVASVGSRASASGYGLLGIGVALAIAAHRRRRQQT